ncbi:MAG: tetratricopeptide repeat-containing sensor histidine kinase [Bacteroidota bacterium]|nr:tetratricopeptide repeat-containing sensor histidine kinase [Bacteroidota bacterium]
MSTNCLYIAFILLGSVVTRGQAPVDSLKAALSGNIADTSKVGLLISLSREYQYANISKSREYAENALKIAESKNIHKHKIRAYHNLAGLYAISGDYSSALRYDNMALQSSVDNRDSANLSVDYNNVASDYYDLGEYDEAYSYFTQSYRIARATNDSLRMAIALHNVGRVFKELGQYDRALDHLNLSMDMSRRINDFEGIPYSLDEIGDVMIRNGQYDSALSILLRSVNLTREQKVFILEPKTLSKLAMVHSHAGDYDKALAYYDTTYLLHQRTGNKFGTAEVELGRGQVFIAQGKYDEAMQSINRSLALAKQTNARTLEIHGYQALSGLYEQRKDFAKSLKYFKQFKQLEDSLFSQDMQEKLLRDQIQFETEEKDTEIAALNQQRDLRDDTIKKQEFIRNILVVVMALSVILLATVYRSGQRRRQINTLLLRHQQEMETRSEELERLNQVKDKFFSIISHDLRSPINALAGLLDLLDKGAVKPEELSRHIHELKSRFNHTRTLLNNLLDWTLLQMDKLNLQPTRIDLRKIADENIQLLGAIPSKQITLHNNIPANTIGFADSNTVNLVLRNLMTNALKFTKDGGDVSIGAEDRGSEWLISVADNGVGMNDDVLNILFDKTAPYTTRGTANEKGTGLGLILCKEFVEKNGGRIFVESREGKGSKFSFTLPKPE